jgi:hypothetical protein
MEDINIRQKERTGEGIKARENARDQSKEGEFWAWEVVGRKLNGILGFVNGNGSCGVPKREIIQSRRKCLGCLQKYASFGEVTPETYPYSVYH